MSRFMPGSSANLTLPDYGRVARDSTRNQRQVPPTLKPWLPRLVKSDAADQVRKTGVAAYGIEEGMYLEELQNV
jgi:hypothetical protein